MSPSSHLPKTAARILLLAGLACATAQAQTEADTLAQGLIRLRGEVEQLNAELNLLREEQRTTLAGLNAQKAELTNSAERQSLAAREAREKLAAREAEIAASSVDGDSLKPLLLTAMAVSVVNFAFNERVVTRANATLKTWEKNDYGPLPRNSGTRNNVYLRDGPNVLAAASHVDAAQASVVLVGDAARVEPELVAAGLGPVSVIHEELPGGSGGGEA